MFPHRTEQMVGPEPREATFASSVIRRSCSVAPWPGQLNRYVAFLPGGHMKLLGLAIFIGLCFVSTSAQTANDLSAKYGAAHQSYEIRPGIFITVKFAADGRACEMWLEKR